MNPGQNNGVSGLIALNPLINGIEVATAPYIQCEVTGGFANALTAQVVDITGPGDDFVARVYGSTVSGTMTVSGKVQSSQRPFPPTVHNLKSTLRHQLDTNSYVEFPVLLQTMTCERDEGSTNLWTFSATCVKDGAQTVVWNGKTATYNQPSLSAKEVFAGSTKANDPQTITAIILTRVFLPTPALTSPPFASYTDTARNFAADAYIAAATAPRANFKVLSYTWDPIDDIVVWLNIQWSYNDSKDAIEKPGTHTDLDPLLIKSEATVTTVYTTADGPGALPAVSSSELQITNVHIEAINPVKSKRVVEEKVLNSQQEHTYPKIETTDDANNIEDRAVRAQFWNIGSSPPATPTDVPTNNVKIIDFTDVPITPTQNMRVFLYGPQDSADKLILPNYETVADASNLLATAVRACLDGSSISDPAGYVVRKTVTRPVTLALGVNRILTVKEYGLRTTAEDIEFPGTKNEVDPADLENQGIQTTVHATASPPADPSPPTHTKIVNKWTIELTSAGTAQSQTVWNFAPQTSIDKIEQGESVTETDPSDLDTRAKLTIVDGSPSTPSGMVLRLTSTRDLSDWHTATTSQYGLRTTAEDITMPGTFEDTDPTAIDSTGRITDIYTTVSGPPTLPPPPAPELQFVRTKNEHVNQLLSKRTIELGTLNGKQKRTYPKISTTDDAQNIDDEAMRAQFWTVGGIAPATPDDPPSNNVKLIHLTDVPITPDQNLRVWLYGERNSRDEEVLKNYDTVADASSLESTAVRACLDTESITDPAGYTLRLTKTFPLSFSLGANRTVTVKVYGLRTTASDVEMPGTSNRIDVSGIESTGKKTTVYTTLSGVPADPTPPTGLQIVASRIEVLNDLKSKKEWDYEVNTPAQKIAFNRSKSSRSPLEPWDDVVSSVIDDSSDLTTAATNYFNIYKTNVNLVRLEVERITPAKVVLTFFYSDPGIMVDGEIAGGTRVAPFRFSGGVPQVYITQELAIDGSDSYYTVRSSAILNSPIRRFAVTRVLAGTSIPDHPGTVGQTNSDTFLGLAAGTVQYLGARFVARYDVSGTRYFKMRYEFLNDPNGIADYLGVKDDSFVFASGSGDGWVDASDFDPVISVVQPDSDDFTTLFLS